MLSFFFFSSFFSWYSKHALTHSATESYHLTLRLSTNFSVTPSFSHSRFEGRNLRVTAPGNGVDSIRLGPITLFQMPIGAKHISRAYHCIQNLPREVTSDQGGWGEVWSTLDWDLACWSGLVWSIKTVGRDMSLVSCKDLLNVCKWANPWSSAGYIRCIGVWAAVLDRWKGCSLCLFLGGTLGIQEQAPRHTSSDEILRGACQMRTLRCAEYATIGYSLCWIGW